MRIEAIVHTHTLDAALYGATHAKPNHIGKYVFQKNGISVKKILKTKIQHMNG